MSAKPVRDAIGKKTYRNDVSAVIINPDPEDVIVQAHGLFTAQSLNLLHPQSLPSPNIVGRLRLFPRHLRELRCRGAPLIG